jgi:hypothetical protein
MSPSRNLRLSSGACLETEPRRAGFVNSRMVLGCPRLAALTRWCLRELRSPAISRRLKKLTSSTSWQAHGRLKPAYQCFVRTGSGLNSPWWLKPRIQKRSSHATSSRQNVAPTGPFGSTLSTKNSTPCAKLALGLLSTRRLGPMS